MRTEKEEKITDDYGGEHLYRCTQHGAEEGYELMRVVMSIIGKAVNDGLALPPPPPGQDPGEQKVTVAMLGGAVAVLCDQLGEKGGVQLLKKIFRHTLRKKTDGSEGWDKVAVEFDTIYQGNYGELGLALKFVLEHNFGPMLRGRLESAGTLQRLASLVKHNG